MKSKYFFGRIEFMFNSNSTRGFGLLENFLAQKRVKMANKLIPQHLRKGVVLDIGCGTHPFFLLNTEFNKKYGMDPSLKKIDEYDENIILKSSGIKNGERLFFDDNSLSVVVMLAVVEHLEPYQLEHTFGEVERVLKKGGRFILTTPCSWSCRLLKLMSKILLISKDEIDDHKGNSNYYKMSECLQQVGFKQKKIKKGYFEFFLNSWTYVDK